MRFKSSLGAIVLALVSLSSVQASIIPALAAGSPTATTGGYTYSYTAMLDGNQVMETGNFLTIYDISGFADQITVNGISAGSVGTTPVSVGDYSVSVQMTGINPKNTAPDDTSLPNITITRTAASTLPSGSSFTFSFRSTFGSPAALIDYAARATFSGGGVSNTGGVNGPAAVPEPSVTVMLGVAGILGLGCSMIRRKRAAV